MFEGTPQAVTALVASIFIYIIIRFKLWTKKGREDVLFYWGRCPDCKTFSVKRWNTKRAYCDTCKREWEIEGL
jgi:hypothetical protein